MLLRSVVFRSSVLARTARCCVSAIVPFGLVALLLVPRVGEAQIRPARWQRSSEATAIPITVFHSPQSANLPTAETLQRGELQFEISHRFVPTFSDGFDAVTSTTIWT
jgi:hypothetical protein